MPSERKLLSILFTDLQGYTAIMESDEALALSLIEAYKKEIEDKTSKHQGRVVQYLGDGALIVFENSTDAVYFGIELQSSLLSIDGIENRIGIHTGEVMIKDGNVHGDSVNVASRIESLAVPNSVLISKVTYDQIKNKKSFHTISLGKHHFKNQTDKMEVFAITNKPLRVPNRKKLKGKTKKTSWSKMYYGILILIISLALFITKSWLEPNPVAVNEPWVGIWNTHMTIETGNTKAGQLIINKNEGNYTGEAEVWYSDSKDLQIMISLYDIVLHEGNIEISGNWSSNLLTGNAAHGQFEFDMDKKKLAFKGKYKIHNTDKWYAWEGLKKKQF